MSKTWIGWAIAERGPGAGGGGSTMVMALPVSASSASSTKALRDLEDVDSEIFTFFLSSLVSFPL